MNHQKEEVIPAADGLWPNILLALTNIDQRFFNGKHQPCPLCGGKDRARYIKRHEMQFHCNVCGDKSGIAFYMELTGISFGDAINDVGDYLNLIPVERRESAKQERFIASNLPDYYEYDFSRYEQLKSEAKIALSPWQRVSGLNMLDILAHGEHALIPLLDRNGNAVDFTMIDIDGNWQTTAGNKTVPVGFYSVFGENDGNRTYITVNPYHAAHASIYTGKKIVCCYEDENLDAVVNNFEGEIVVIVSSVTETQEADTLKLPQLTFNKQNNTVNRRLWQPFEIMDKRNEK